MFPNLDAEQARNRHSNVFVADHLHISRQVYENKKRAGKFTAVECRILCDLYKKSFEYLFAYESDSTA